MRGFSTGRYIGQEELELWTLPGWFPALGKPGFPQIPQLRRLGLINRISETDRLQIPTPERAPGPEAGIIAGYAPIGAAGTENHPQILLRRQTSLQLVHFEESAGAEAGRGSAAGPRRRIEGSAVSRAERPPRRK